MFIASLDLLKTRLIFLAFSSAISLVGLLARLNNWSTTLSDLSIGTWVSVVGMFSFDASCDLDRVLDWVFLTGVGFLFGGGGVLDLNLLPFEPDLLNGDRTGDLFKGNLPFDLDLVLDLRNGERFLRGDLYLGLMDRPLKGDLPLDQDLLILDLDVDLENRRLGDLENDLNRDLDLDFLGDQDRLGVNDRLGDLPYLGEGDLWRNLLGLIDLERDKLLRPDDLDLYFGGVLDLKWKRFFLYLSQLWVFHHTVSWHWTSEQVSDKKQKKVTICFNFECEFVSKTYCLYVLSFYGPVNTIKVMFSQSVNLSTLFLDRLPMRLTSTKSP